MRNFTTTSVTTFFANTTGTVRGVVIGVGTSFARTLCDARFLLKRLATPVADEMVAVRVYRKRPVTGCRRPMAMRMDLFHSWSSGSQGGSWSESAVNNRF